MSASCTFNIRIQSFSHLLIFCLCRWSELVVLVMFKHHIFKSCIFIWFNYTNCLRGDLWWETPIFPIFMHAFAFGVILVLCSEDNPLSHLATDTDIAAEQCIICYKNILTHLIVKFISKKFTLLIIPIALYWFFDVEFDGFIASQPNS